MKPGTTNLFSVLVSLLCLWLPASPAHAVVQIHDVYWAPGDGNVPSQGKIITVTFDVTVTEADADGLSFSIQETQSQQTLLEFDYPDLGVVPSAGVPMTIYYSFQVVCDQAGTLSAQSTQVYVVYCDPNMPLVPLYDWQIDGPWSTGVASTGGSFVLAVADESGTAETNTTNTVQCGATTDVTTDLLTIVKRQRSERLDRLAVDGDSGTFGIYFDPAGTICSGEILPGVPTNVYVVARLDGISACGMIGGEFRFSGVPDSWTVFPVARDDMLSIGNPFTNGVSFGFTECQQPTNDAVVIFSVLVLATALQHDVEFMIRASNPPSNSNKNCPLLAICDPPVFAGICVDGISCYVNPTSTRACTITVGVENSTWTSMKQLFRD